MILPKLHDSLIERRERVEQLAETLQPFLRTGHAGLLLARITPKCVGVYIAPRDEIIEHASLHDNSPVYDTDAEFAEAIVDRIERLAVPGVDGLASIDSRAWALVEVLREHRARLDLVVLYPDSAACEILPSSNPADRADFLANRPGAIDLTAMPLKDAVARIQQHRAAFGDGLGGAAPRTLSGALPRDTYRVLATRADGTDGDQDLTCGVSTVELDCRVPLEDRYSAVLDVFHSKVAIAELDDWQFAVLAPDAGNAPQGTAYEPEHGAYEGAGILELGGDPYDLGNAGRVEVTTSSAMLTIGSARIAGVALIRIDSSEIIEARGDGIAATLTRHPGSVRLDDAYPYAATEALADAREVYERSQSRFSTPTT